MVLTYFKRFRMEVDLSRAPRSELRLPEGYRLIPWDLCLLSAHAEAKFQSFRTEIDANVFPCLGNFDGCVRLMQEISRKDGFLPEATWLLAFNPHADRNRADRNGAARRSIEARLIEARSNAGKADWAMEALAGSFEFCGTVQGVRDRFGVGAIQNLGITPEHRGLGLGTCLLLESLKGFSSVGLRRVYLEVTAQNDGAIRLYRRLGFVKARTVYKAVDVAACHLG